MILNKKKSNYEIFYQRVRCLFPSIGFKEGKFLRDLNFHLRDFSFSHPNCTYEDIVDFFGAPEEIFINYIESEGIETMSKKFLLRKYLRTFIYITSIFLFFIWVTYFIFWVKSYREFVSVIPAYGEVTIEEGVMKP